MVVAQALLGAPTSQLLGLPRPNTPAHCPRGPPRHPGICRQRRWRGGAAGPTPLAALFAGTSGAAASGDDVGGGGGGERVWTASGYLSGSESDGGELSWAEVERRLAVALNLIATSELLVPYDRSAVNLGLIVWGAIRDIPAAHRHLLVDRLPSSGIAKLWKLAGQRFRAAQSQAAAAMGPDASLWADMPSRLSQLSLFKGRAALPTDLLGVSWFTQAFFLTPGGEAAFGRTLLGKGPLLDWIYPLYFRMTLGPTVVPLGQDLCDLTLEYLDPPELQLSPADVPRSLWPPPRRQLAPFNEQWAHYVRAAGPGVYVGIGLGLQRGAEPLHFVMAHTKTENLI